MKLQVGLISFEVNGGIPDEFVRSENFKSPVQQEDKDSKLFMVGTPDMGERGLAYSIGYEQVLAIVSPGDLGLANMLITKYKFGYLVSGDDMVEVGSDLSMLIRPIFSIVGPSIFHRYERSSKDLATLRAKYDLVIKPPSSGKPTGA